jgi:hypothetical protein
MDILTIPLIAMGKVSFAPLHLHCASVAEQKTARR